MIDNSRVVLEDGVKYVVIDKIIENKIAYIYLVNPSDSQNLCARKEIEEDGKTFLVGLDSREEADLALKLFVEKHQND